MNTTLSRSAPPPAAPDPWLARTATIESIEVELPDVATYWLRCRDAEPATVRPGQFHMLYVPGIGEVAISVSAVAPDGRAWGHTIRRVGSVTQVLSTMRVGQTLGLRGPFGAAWPLDEVAGADVVIVAGGIGLAPLRLAVESLLNNRAGYGRLVLLLGAREPTDLLYARQFADWSARGMLIQTTVDRPTSGWTGRVGVVTLLLDRLPMSRSTVLFTCGPEVMMKYVMRGAMARGLAADRIWCSLERNMQCAVGFCGHCQLGPEFVCKDGPVFRCDRVMRLLAEEGL